MALDQLPELNVRNYVSSGNLGMRFELSSIITKSNKKVELVAKKNCVLMKLAHPHAGATAMLFANGKLVCSGMDSEDGIRSAARRFTQIIQKMDYPGVNLIDFKIQNVVGTCDVGFRVLIEELSFAHSGCCTYEPELYPALIYRLERPKVKILVFVSGKVVLTGSKSSKDLHSAVTAIYPILCQFRDTKRSDASFETHASNVPRLNRSQSMDVVDVEDHEEEDESTMDE